MDPTHSLSWAVIAARFSAHELRPLNLPQYRNSGRQPRDNRSCPTHLQKFYTDKNGHRGVSVRHDLPEEDHSAQKTTSQHTLIAKRTNPASIRPSVQPDEIQHLQMMLSDTEHSF